MKIRYYLRGLGLGILVTAIFFMVSDNSSGTMSDEMIKQRARELGMTESMVLAELASAEETVSDTETILEEESATESTIPEETVYEEPVMEGTAEETVSEEAAEETVTETEQEAAEEVLEETTQETVQSKEEMSTETVAETDESVSANTEPVTIVVNRGEGSDTVSRRLQEAGLVADAHEYDRYLMTNGYDKKIGVGEHVIPAGATWEEIAKILCNM